jgi:starch synthase (maltosyl-transferring)
VIFWEWVIREVQKVFPDVLFLAEAFTRPRMMEMLAKVGFTQSYTYFTWRSEKQELTDYFKYLTQGPAAEYMRGNLFPTTPDIHPKYLHHAGPAMFKTRLALATTLSSVYGMYSGFEFCENEPFPGKEELNFSEKYEFKVRDWEQPGIRDFVRDMNRIRRTNPALQEYTNLQFCECTNDQILAYVKITFDAQNIILVAVNLDADNKQVATLKVPLDACGLSAERSFAVHDLLTDERYFWTGEVNYIELTPENPVHVLRIEC